MIQNWFWLSFTAEAELVRERSLEKQNECWAGGGQVEGPEQQSVLLTYCHPPALRRNIIICLEPSGAKEHI